MIAGPWFLKGFIPSHVVFFVNQCSVHDFMMSLITCTIVLNNKNPWLWLFNVDARPHVLGWVSRKGPL